MKTSAIVPVFNEEKNVSGVINTLLESPQIHEIIAVNDGSTDQSLQKLQAFAPKITIINFPKNKGKAKAMVAGIKAAKHEIVAFFDSDLQNLSQKHISTLLSPILNKKTRAVLGIPAKIWVFGNITGERAYYHEDLLPHLEEIGRIPFGAEVYLNKTFKKRKKIRLRGLLHPTKLEKKGSLIQKIKDYFWEIVDLIKASL